MKSTDTTFSRVHRYTGDRQIVTVLTADTTWAYCAIETVARDGSYVEDTLGTMPTTIIPVSTLAAVSLHNRTATTK